MSIAYWFQGGRYHEACVPQKYTAQIIHDEDTPKSSPACWPDEPPFACAHCGGWMHLEPAKTRKKVKP